MKVKQYFIRFISIIVAVMLCFPAISIGSFSDSENTLNADINSYKFVDDTLYLYIGNKPNATLTYNGKIKIDSEYLNVEVDWQKTGEGRLKFDLSGATSTVTIDCNTTFQYNSSLSGGTKVYDFIVLTKGIEVKKINGEWNFSEYKTTPPEPQTTNVDFTVTDYAIYDKKTMTPSAWQLIIYTNTDLSPYINKGSFSGKILIDGNEVQTKWYAVANSDSKFTGAYRIYTVDIPYSAKKIDIQPECKFDYSNDETIKLNITNGLGLYFATRMWVKDGEAEPSPEVITASYDTIAFDSALNKSQIKFTSKEDYGNYWCNTEVYIDDVPTTTNVYISNGWGVIGNKMANPDDPVVIALKEYKKIKICKNSTLKVIGDDSKVFFLNFSDDVVLEYNNDLNLWTSSNGKPKEDTIIENIVTNSIIYNKSDLEPPCWQWVLTLDEDISSYTGSFVGKINVGTEEISTVWHPASGNRIYTVDIPFELGDSADSIEITSNSIFVYQQDISVKLNFTEGTKLAKLGDQWVVDTGNVGYTETAPTFELIASDRLQLKNDRYLGKGEGNNRYPSAPYNEWSTFKGIVYIDDVAKEYNFTIASNYIFLYEITSKISAAKIQIKAGTVLSAEGLNPIKVLNDINIIKDGKNWFQVANINDSIVYNNVSLSFYKFDGNGFYFDGIIVSGPDKGKNLGEVYGEWKSGSGDVAYNKSDVKEATFSANGNHLYIASNIDIDTVDQITISKGTVIIPFETALCRTPIKIENTIDVIRDKKYNRFVLNDGTVDKEVNFNDVRIVKVRVTGNELQLYSVLEKNPQEQIKDVYGDWVGAVGNILIKDEDLPMRTKEGTTYKLAGKSLYLYDIAPGFKDAITIPAGTLLWPDSSAKCQDPIRIINSVNMTRDENDDWVINVNKDDSNSYRVSPATGDDFSFRPLLIILITMSMCAFIYSELDRRYNNPKENN